ncbi:hypothetical protein Bca4012_086259 [Brassica carinata]
MTDHLNAFQDCSTSCAIWASSLMMRFTMRGFSVLYRTLGRFSGCLFVTPRRKVLFRWIR